MNRILASLILVAFGLPMTVQAGNTEMCEAAIMEPAMTEDGEVKGAKIASFRPAENFINSVYDEEDGHMDEIEGYKIRAVLCSRGSVIPTLRDFPLVATGIPIALSPDFDKPDSAVSTVYFHNGKFHHLYDGPELSEDDQASLEQVMEIFNMQPHDLNDSKEDEPTHKDK